MFGDLKDKEKIYGVFYKKRNRHDRLLIAFETEKEAIDYIKEKSNEDKLLFYREMSGKDILYWLLEYDKK